MVWYGPLCTLYRKSLQNVPSISDQRVYMAATECPKSFLAGENENMNNSFAVMNLIETCEIWILSLIVVCRYRGKPETRTVCVTDNIPMRLIVAKNE